MLLKSIKLENIRSYTNSEISFPEGSLLLSGDVGSGKTTILLAIEFALFGIRGKGLTGGSLLRNGKNEGSAELQFSIDGKDIIIKRKLKRGKNSVSQIAGYIVINGIKKEGTPVELKTEIVNLLGYPKELVSKSKNLVYRYTVYTPQEEMKQILTEEEEERLDTLRKVFGIDKYKRIRENAVIYVRELKNKRAVMEGKVSDLDDKKRLKEEKQKEIEKFKKNLIELEPKVFEFKEKVKAKKLEISSVEEKINEKNNLQRKLEVLEANMRNLLEQRLKNSEQIELLEQQINILRKEIEGKNEKEIQNIEQEESIIQESIILEEKKLSELQSKIYSLDVKKRSSLENKNKVQDLENCPTCLQNVSIEHKRLISERENQNILKYDKEREEFSLQAKSIQENIKELNFKLGQFMKIKNEFSGIKVKIQNISEKEDRKNLLLIEQESMKKKIGEINMKKISLNKKLEEFGDISERYRKLRQELDLFLEEEKKVEIEKNGLEREKQSLVNYLVEIEKEINEKLEIKKKLTYISELQNWMEESFVNLMAVMEKQVMFSVYNEFNELFMSWFNMMMGDENLNARLDDNFTPIIEQNGYETSIEFLSGGERTAAALSYRLALNKVVNDMMGNIKTKDLIILDEPTDGFSTEQLDRVRDVLEEIGVKQTIIVSHESKIESFVDSVVRVSKSEHVSVVE